MLQAIHKSSGRKVTSYLMEADLEWTGKEKDEFLVILDYVENADDFISTGEIEIPCIFIKSHIRLKATPDQEFVTAHFRCNHPKFIENKWMTESKEHKIAKQYIYDNWRILKIYEGNNEYNLIDLGVKDIRIERGVGLKRADVLVDFKEPHEIFGKGICFEVQLSTQTERKTIERTFDRCAYGYSVTWVYSDSLQNIEQRKFPVITFRDGIKRDIEETDVNFKNEFSNLAKKIKTLYSDKLQDIYNQLEQNKINISKIDNIKQETIKEYQTWLDNVASKLANDSRDKLQELFKENINQYSSRIDNIVSSYNWNEFIQKHIDQNIKSGNIQFDKILVEEIKKQMDFKPLVTQGFQELKEQYSNDMKSNLSKELEVINSKVKESIESNVQYRIEQSIMEFLPNTINKVTEDKFEILRNELREEGLRKILTNLKQDSVSLYLKNKCEIYMQDPLDNKHYNIFEFKIIKDSNGNLILKRGVGDESKS